MRRTLSGAGAGHWSVSLHRDCVLVLQKICTKIMIRRNIAKSVINGNIAFRGWLSVISECLCAIKYSQLLQNVNFIVILESDYLKFTQISDLFRENAQIIWFIWGNVQKVVELGKNNEIKLNSGYIKLKTCEQYWGFWKFGSIKISKRAKNIKYIKYITNVGRIFMNRAYP